MSNANNPVDTLSSLDAAIVAAEKTLAYAEGRREACRKEATRAAIREPMRDRSEAYITAQRGWAAWDASARRASAALPGMRAEWLARTDGY